MVIWALLETVAVLGIAGAIVVSAVEILKTARG
jgi:hypothetical protein